MRETDGWREEKREAAPTAMVNVPRCNRGTGTQSHKQNTRLQKVWRKRVFSVLHTLKSQLFIFLAGADISSSDPTKCTEI